jgi:hypothetical protein
MLVRVSIKSGSRTVVAATNRGLTRPEPLSPIKEPTIMSTRDAVQPTLARPGTTLNDFRVHPALPAAQQRSSRSTMALVAVLVAAGLGVFLFV